MTTEQQLDALIASLPKQLEPATDGWDALAARLAETPQAKVEPMPPSEQTQTTVAPAWMQRPAANQPRYGLAAAVAAGFALVTLWLLKPAPVSESQVAQQLESTTVTTQPHTQSRDVVQQLRLQREKLMAQVGGAQLKQLQQVPQGFENWQQQLAIWQQASSQLEQALQQQPANRRLLRQYQQLQQQQLKYMHKLTELSQAYS
ncbi:MAG TPA: hypothetical protein DCS87_07065 [Rheinheimera sp.]|nr:hypothetical protein [Rheinheimera sp.]